MQLYERQSDILKIVEQLDISPTMYKNAEDKYKALASFLEACGIKADIYPQGSFALGTVVRPSAKDPNAAYDLDFICQVKQTRNEISPSELRRKIKKVLESDERYSKRLEVCDECFTIKYADIGEISFSIDVVPATDETISRKQELSKKSLRPELIDTAIAIPRCNEKKDYDWLTNNPKGFRVWFEEKNRPFLMYGQAERRKRIFEANSRIYATVDDIPEGLERSAMQRVIQILKRHRDVYYSKLRREDAENLKPISAIINTLVAVISSTASPETGIFELLEFVLAELNLYSDYQTMTFDEFTRKNGAHSAISKSKYDGRWEIQNPANPEDNLADKWNENTDIPKYFFLWIKACFSDLTQSMTALDEDFRTRMENAFGTTVIQRGWGNKYKSATRIEPKPIVTNPKPYRA